MMRRDRSNHSCTLVSDSVREPAPLLYGACGGSVKRIIDKEFEFYSEIEKLYGQRSGLVLSKNSHPELFESFINEKLKLSPISKSDIQTKAAELETALGYIDKRRA